MKYLRKKMEKENFTIFLFHYYFNILQYKKNPWKKKI